MFLAASARIPTRYSRFSFAVHRERVENRFSLQTGAPSVSISIRVHTRARRRPMLVVRINRWANCRYKRQNSLGRSRKRNTRQLRRSKTTVLPPVVFFPGLSNPFFFHRRRGPPPPVKQPFSPPVTHFARDPFARRRHDDRRARPTTAEGTVAASCLTRYGEKTRESAYRPP